MRGRILVADQDGVYLLKFEGDVRVTLCATIDHFLDDMFSDPTFQSVIIDLSSTEGIDSTALGLLAKLSMQAQRRRNLLPVLVCSNPNILRVLYSMGFEDVFDLRSEFDAGGAGLGALGYDCASEEETRLRVLEAHRTLMALNSTNEARFRDLVATLEAATTLSAAGR